MFWLITVSGTVFLDEFMIVLHQKRFGLVQVISENYGNLAPTLYSPFTKIQPEENEVSLADRLMPLNVC